MRLLALIALLPLALAALACRTSEDLTLTNPTDQTLYVQVNEREPFPLAAGETARTSVPALDRLAPITITARDEYGRTIFYRSTTVQLLRAARMQLSLTPTGDPWDPYSDYRDVTQITSR
jgi:hypothetical protein